MSDFPKDFRTPEAKKWPEEFLPPETCGSIDDAQNALEHLRDTNSQLRHAAHVWKHCAEDELQRRRSLGTAATADWQRFARIIRLCGLNGSPQERLATILAVATEGRDLHAARPTGVSDEVPGKPHEVGELEEHKALSPLVGQGSSNASQARMGPVAHPETGSQPSGRVKS